MSNIFLFTGENSYALCEEKYRWIHEFKAKHGDENMIRLEAKTTQISALLSEIGSAPFIAEKRLVVLEGIPKMEKEDVERILNAIHPAVLLLIVEPKPDKRLGATKILLKEATVKDFPPLALPALKKWMDALVSKEGGTMQPEARDRLIEIAGQDQAMLYQELQKLVLGAQGKPIDSALVDRFVLLSGEQVIWKLSDLLGARKFNDAVVFMEDLQQRGEDAHGIWARLLWMLGNLVSIAIVMQDGITQPQAIAAETKMNPFSVRALLPLARSLTAEQTKRLAATLADADIALKTGVHRAGTDSPQELACLMDKCVLSLAQ